MLVSNNQRGTICGPNHSPELPCRQRLLSGSGNTTVGCTTMRELRGTKNHDRIGHRAGPEPLENLLGRDKNGGCRPQDTLRGRANQGDVPAMRDESRAFARSQP